MRDVLQARWSEIGDKIVRLAEELPAESWNFRPTSDTRSFGDQLRHVAFWNQYVEKTLRGDEADGQDNELPAARYPGQQEVLPVLRASFADVAAALGNGVTESAEVLDTLVSFIEHSGEHYGQLVLYYRLQGLVPPASRG
jgi:uncharacterized damage-inducible protein DinB